MKRPSAAPRDPRRSRTSSCERTWRRVRQQVAVEDRPALKNRGPGTLPTTAPAPRGDDAATSHHGDSDARPRPDPRARATRSPPSPSPSRRSPALAEIHIGVILSTTGPAASLGIPAEQAIKLWPGEIAGEKVRFTILNDGTDTTTATKNAQRLINEDKVDLIIGSSVTPTSLAVVETAGTRRCR